jgi:hypothetical protein
MIFIQRERFGATVASLILVLARAAMGVRRAAHVRAAARDVRPIHLHMVFSFRSLL